MVFTSTCIPSDDSLSELDCSDKLSENDEFTSSSVGTVLSSFSLNEMEKRIHYNILARGCRLLIRSLVHYLDEMCNFVLICDHVIVNGNNLE